MAFSEAQVKNLEASSIPSTSGRVGSKIPPSPMSKAGMSSPRPTASLDMTPGTGIPFPRAVFGLPRLTTTMPPPISQRSALRSGRER